MHSSADDRLIRHFLRWTVPRPPFGHSGFERLCNHSSDLLALQRHEFLIGIISVELRAEIQSMDSGIISVDDDKVLRPQKNVEFSYNLSLQRGDGNAKFFRRRANDGSGLQQDDPVSLPGVIAMDRDKMTRRSSSENAHGYSCGQADLTPESPGPLYAGY